MKDLNSTPHSQMLVALNTRTYSAGAHIYAGTVPAPEKARRRAANKAARRSRRINRGNQ